MLVTYIHASFGLDALLAWIDAGLVLFTDPVRDRDCR